MSVTPINSLADDFIRDAYHRAPDDSLPLSLEPFADFDWRLAEEAAYQRGLRMGHRNARVQYGRGRFVGFILGMLALGGLLAALWIIDWLASL